MNELFADMTLIDSIELVIIVLLAIVLVIMWILMERRINKLEKEHLVVYEQAADGKWVKNGRVAVIMSSQPEIHMDDDSKTEGDNG